MKLKLLLATVGTLSLIGCGGGGSGTDPVEYVPYDAPAISQAQKQEFLDAVNDARAVGRTCGSKGYYPAANPVAWSDDLYNAAYEHSYDMGTANVHQHNGSGKDSDWTAQVLDLAYSTARKRALNNGISSSKATGENIYWGTGESYETVDAAIDWWIDSDSHCATLMGTQWTRIGLAKYEASDADFNVYWTNTFSN